MGAFDMLDRHGRSACVASFDRQRQRAINILINTSSARPSSTGPGSNVMGLAAGVRGITHFSQVQNARVRRLGALSQLKSDSETKVGGEQVISQEAAEQEAMMRGLLTVPLHELNKQALIEALEILGPSTERAVPEKQDEDEEKRLVEKAQADIALAERRRRRKIGATARTTMEHLYISLEQLRGNPNEFQHLQTRCNQRLKALNSSVSRHGERFTESNKGRVCAHSPEIRRRAHTEWRAKVKDHRRETRQRHEEWIAKSHQEHLEMKMRLDARLAKFEDVRANMIAERRQQYVLARCVAWQPCIVAMCRVEMWRRVLLERRLLLELYREKEQAVLTIQKAMLPWLSRARGRKIRRGFWRFKRVFAAYVVDWRVKRKCKAAETIMHFAKDLGSNMGKELTAACRKWKRCIVAVQRLWRANLQYRDGLLAAQLTSCVSVLENAWGKGPWDDSIEAIKDFLSYWNEVAPDLTYDVATPPWVDETCLKEVLMQSTKANVRCFWNHSRCSL